MLFFLYILAFIIMQSLYITYITVRYKRERESRMQRYIYIFFLILFSLLNQRDNVPPPITSNGIRFFFYWPCRRQIADPVTQTQPPPHRIGSSSSTDAKINIITISTWFSCMRIICSAGFVIILSVAQYSASIQPRVLILCVDRVSSQHSITHQYGHYINYMI